MASDFAFGERARAKSPLQKKQTNFSTMQHFVNIILYRLSGDKFCILYRLSEFYIDSHTDILLRHIYVDSPEKKRGGVAFSSEITISGTEIDGSGFCLAAAAAAAGAILCTTAESSLYTRTAWTHKAALCKDTYTHTYHLYTSEAADDLLCLALCGRRII